MKPTLEWTEGYSAGKAGKPRTTAYTKHRRTSWLRGWDSGEAARIQHKMNLERWIKQELANIEEAETPEERCDIHSRIATYQAELAYYV